MKNATLPDYIKNQLSAKPPVLGGTYDQFESALERVYEMYTNVPDGIDLRINITMKNELYGTTPRSALLGILKEQIELMNAIYTVWIYKAFELCCGIKDGLRNEQHRLSILSCRTLFEEAATLQYYLQDALSKNIPLLAIPVSTFRTSKLEKFLSTNDAAELKELVKTLSAANAVWRKCLSARRIDFRKPDLFQNPDLDKKDPSFQTNVITALKKITFDDGKTAAFFYAILCDATHPNVGALGLYANNVSNLNGFQVFNFRKIRDSSDIYSYITELLLRPTIEAISILDNTLVSLAEQQTKIESFKRKIEVETA